MRIPFLASHAIQIRYRGTATTHTIAVDADGGTTAGLLTLTDDDGASAFDLGNASYNTGAELVAAINAITDTGWEARLFRYQDLGPIISSVDLNTADKFSDLATESVPTHWTNYLEYSASTVSVAASTTATPDRAVPVPVADWNHAIAMCESVLAGAGTDSVTFTFTTAALQYTTIDTAHAEADKKLTELGDSDWGTNSYTGYGVLASNGTTQVRMDVSLSVSGYQWLKLGTVANASSGQAATIGGYYSEDSIS